MVKTLLFGSESSDPVLNTSTTWPLRLSYHKFAGSSSPWWFDGFFYVIKMIKYNKNHKKFTIWKFHCLLKSSSIERIHKGSLKERTNTFYIQFLSQIQYTFVKWDLVGPLRIRKKWVPFSESLTYPEFF